MRRLYSITALVAIIQLFATAGLLGYLFATGRINAERIDRIASILRGKDLARAAATTQPTTAAAKVETATSQIARSRMEQDYLMLIAERHRRELEDRARLNQTIQHDVLRKLEEIERREKALAEQQKKALEQGSQGGAAREVELVTAIEPTRARKLLMMQKEPDAVRLLLGMDPGRARKILDTCKTQEEMEWARRILDQLRNMDAGAGAEAPGSSLAVSTGG